MKTRKTLLFLMFAFGVSWLSAGVLFVSGVKYGSGLSMLVVATLYMMAPAVSALIVQRLIYKEPIKELGFDFKQTQWKRFLWIPLIQVVFCLFAIGFIVLLGNVFQVKGFGYFSLDQALLDQRFREIAATTGATSIPSLPISPFVLLIVIILASIFLGGLINTIFTLGEELGWRGFLYNQTKHLGFWKSNLLIGTVWGLWHAPIILQGHNYPEHPVAGVFMMVPFCISLGFIMSWLRAKTNSILAPALFHGMINAVGGGVMLFCYQYSDLIGNIAGLAGILGCSAIVLLIAIFDKKTIAPSTTTEQPQESDTIQYGSGRVF